MGMVSEARVLVGDERAERAVGWRAVSLSSSASESLRSRAEVNSMGSESVSESETSSGRCSSSDVSQRTEVAWVVGIRRARRAGPDRWWEVGRGGREVQFASVWSGERQYRQALRDKRSARSSSVRRLRWVDVAGEADELGGERTGGKDLRGARASRWRR